MLRIIGSLLIIGCLADNDLENDSYCNDINCGTAFSPVCGSDGKTYRNICELERAMCKDHNITIVQEGRCTNCDNRLCISLYDPVCGTDGTTYSNSCFLRIAQCRNPELRFKSRGRCGKTKMY